jgi:hypothetical protein
MFHVKHISQICFFVRFALSSGLNASGTRGGGETQGGGDGTRPVRESQLKAKKRGK